MNETSATQRIVALHKLPKIYGMISQAEQRRADEQENTLETLFIFFNLVFKSFSI